MYYLLTGHPPFPDGTLPQRLMAHQKSLPPDISLERPDVPPDLIEICNKMMAKKPDRRYQTAQEVADVLADWLTAHGHGSSMLGGSSTRPPAPARRVAALPVARREFSGEDARPATLAKADQDISADTMANLDGSTVKGPPPIPVHMRSNDLSNSDIGRKIRAVKHLPMATPLEMGPASEFVIPIDDLLAASRPRSPAPAVTDAQMEAYRRRRQNPVPGWMWLAIAAALLVGGVLLAVLIKLYS